MERKSVEGAGVQEIERRILRDAGQEAENVETEGGSRGWRKAILLCVSTVSDFQSRETAKTEHTVFAARRI